MKEKAVKKEIRRDVICNENDELRFEDEDWRLTKATFYTP